MQPGKKRLPRQAWTPLHSLGVRHSVSTTERSSVTTMDWQATDRQVTDPRTDQNGVNARAHLGRNVQRQDVAQLPRAALGRAGREAGPEDASRPTHPRGSEATKGWRWPSLRGRHGVVLTWAEL
jgi:hypothetical protein